jgi:hypothetical protein
MKWRRWAFVTLCLLTLIGLYSARRSIISWTLSSRFATRIESKSLETSFQNNSFEMHEASVTLKSGQSIKPRERSLKSTRERSGAAT